MSALLILAGAFASIIAVGCGVVYLHDALERVRGGAGGGNVAGNGGGLGQPAPVWRTRRLSGPQVPSGKIVWVRAGNNRVHQAPAAPEAVTQPRSNRR